MKTTIITEFQPGELTTVEEGLYSSIAAHITTLGAELTKAGHGDEATVASLTRAAMQIAANAKGLADQLGIRTDV